MKLNFKSKLVVFIYILTMISACSKTNSTNITFEPKRLEDCEKNEVVTVNWDFPATHANVSVFVADGSKEKLFVQGPSVGSRQTGEWARPGTRFIIKDNSTNNVLGEAVIDGPQCKFRLFN